MTFCSVVPLLLHCIFGFGLSACASDSKIYGPTYTEIETQLSTLAAQFPNLATKVTYGTSGLGRNLILFRIALKSPTPPSGHGKAVYISGATHGDEYLQIPDFLLIYFLTKGKTLPHFQQFLKNGGTIYLNPIFNPDGYEQHIRRSSHHIDLNRDFPIQKVGHRGFRENETRQFTQYLEKDLHEHQLKLVFTMDYHCCGSALLYPWSFPGAKIPSTDLQEHQNIGDIMRSIFGDSYRYGNTDEILTGVRVGTSKDFFYENYHSLSFTFEGHRGIENRNFFKHVQMWEEIFNQINAI